MDTQGHTWTKGKIFPFVMGSRWWRSCGLAFLLVAGLGICQSPSVDKVQAASRLYSYVDSRGILHVTNIPLDVDNYGRMPGRAKEMGQAMDVQHLPAENRLKTDHGYQKWEMDISDTIVKAALHHGLDPDLVGAIVEIESGGSANAISSTGARGLMQLMPETARELGIIDPFDPRANIWGGTRYLKMLLTRFDGDVILALAAYNAGPGRVERFGGVPPFRETRKYIRRVIYRWKRNKTARASR